MSKFDPLRFIADHAGMSLVDAISEAYRQGQQDAQPEIKPIEFQDCANAMLRMWMDKVVTDGEYNRIMDKLNAFWETKKEGEME